MVLWEYGYLVIVRDFFSYPQNFRLGWKIAGVIHSGGVFFDQNVDMWYSDRYGKVCLMDELYIYFEVQGREFVYGVDE